MTGMNLDPQGMINNMPNIYAPSGRNLKDFLTPQVDVNAFLTDFMSKKGGGSQPPGYQSGMGGDLSKVPQAPAWGNGQSGLPADARAGLLNAMKTRSRTGDASIPNPEMPMPMPMPTPAPAPTPPAAGPAAQPGQPGGMSGLLQAMLNRRQSPWPVDAP